MTWTPRLTPTQVANLLTDIANGMSKPAVAEKYNVSERTVYRRLKLPPPPPRSINTKYLPENKKLKPCGTDAAYRRHLRNKEYPCSKCLEAHAKDVIERKYA